MKTYRVYARYTSHCYLDVEANSEEEAYAIAEETDGYDFETDTTSNEVLLEDTWELYDCEEV